MMDIDQVGEYIKNLEKENDWEGLIEIKGITQEAINSLLKKGFRGYRIEFDDGKVIYSNSQRTGMKRMVNYLIREYDMMDKIEVPYVSETNDFPACVINSEEKYRDNTAMNSAVKLNQGYYLETGVGKKYKKVRMEEIAEEAELEVNFEGKWR